MHMFAGRGLGNVLGKRMNQQHNSGYLTVGLRDRGKLQHKQVHWLVAETMLLPPFKQEFGRDATPVPCARRLQRDEGERGASLTMLDVRTKNRRVGESERRTRLCRAPQV